MTQKGTFEVSNSACPIKTIVITDAAAAFDSTVTVPGIELTLKEANTGVVGEYEYSALATAEGGATLELTGKMSVTT